jgi:transposase-like protein
MKKRKFTKEFKEAAVRLVEEGTPIKAIARAYEIDPSVLRAWRDELRELGANAFSDTGKREFTKEFKEAAVMRVEQGTALKKVARSCRISPRALRQWRDRWRTLGAEAFLNREREERSNLSQIRMPRRKFTREFKEAVARRVESGTPVKELARTYDLSPEMVRQWRDELHDLGVHAFSRNGKRRFTKEFKEAAVRRVEEGTSVKAVARAYRLHPTKLRRWRDALRDLGAGSALRNPHPVS